MKRISLLTLAIVLGTTACHDHPTQPQIRRPSLIAVSGDASIPAPALYYVLANGELTLTWMWSDDQPWDLVSFDLTVTGEKVEGEWNIKPYAPDEAGIYESRTFTWSGDGFGQTVPPVCVSVMAKNRSGKGTPTTTYHAENCDPVSSPGPGDVPQLRAQTISAGAAFVCGVGVSGDAYCWGKNSFGQLGDGTTTDRSRFWPVAGGLTFTQISAYGWDPTYFGGHTCALTSSGSAYCWGHNGNGQLGDGTNVHRHVPTAVSGGLRFTQIDVGLAYTCGVTTTGDAYCWGFNALGQLGDGTTADRWTPQPVSGGLKFAQVSAGGKDFFGMQVHTCGITTAGAAYCWGANMSGQIGNGPDSDLTYSAFPSPVSGGLTFRQISAGGWHSCGVTTSGAGYCWGHGHQGQLGDGRYITRSEIPAAVIGGHTFVQISAGESHACGLTTSGMAYCWGLNHYGELGIGPPFQTTYETAAPTAVLGGLRYTQISAGFRVTCAVTVTGAAYCWGTSPSRTLAAPLAGQLSAGDHHACALSPGRDAYCWGYNAMGQLGDGSTSNKTIGVVVEPGFAFTQISSGLNHTCGLTATGSAYCWGENLYGQLGDGTTTDRSTPTPVGGGLAFSRIDAGGEHTCGLTSSGVYCWGRNNHGQLGDGTATARPTPTPVLGGYTFQQIATGTQHTCALTASGQAYCWGSDGVIEYHVPSLVPGGLVFTQLANGDSFTCGLTGSGAAYCWGANPDGQLGDGTTINKPFPTTVLGGLTFTQISAGPSHACAVTAAGAAYCWGWNLYGQLGDGTTTSRSTPTPVLGGLALEKISAGGYFTCGADFAGIPYCWGANGFGELGDGTTTARSTPSAHVIVWLTFRS